MSIFQGKIAFVTGAGSGIGRGLAVELARRGARVTVTDVDARAAEDAARECGPGATARGLDVRDAGAVKAAMEEAARAGGRLDYLFNNAGIGMGGEVQELSVAHWDRIIDVNIRGVVHGVVAAYPLMVKQGAGHIVNTASLAGLTPTPLLVPYGMTKHAVVGLSTGLRIEAAPLGVKVSALCPAAVETPILDSAIPKDLPALSWGPNIRRFLTALAGPPYPLDRAVNEALAGVERNDALIVLPRRARIVHRLARTAPGLVEVFARGPVQHERNTRGQ